MKLKAVVSPNLPIRLICRLIDPELDTWYKEKVVAGCLHVERVRVSGHYIQWPDFMVQAGDGECGIEVSFSKLSARFDRSGKDFEDARQMIESKFAEIIRNNLPRGRTCELYIGSQTDREVEGPDGNFRTLHERDYVVVEGMAEPDDKLDSPAGNFTLKPLQSFLGSRWRGRVWFNTKPTPRRTRIGDQLGITR